MYCSDIFVAAANLQSLTDNTIATSTNVLSENNSVNSSNVINIINKESNEIL